MPVLLYLLYFLCYNSFIPKAFNFSKIDVAEFAQIAVFQTECKKMSVSFLTNRKEHGMICSIGICRFVRYVAFPLPTPFAFWRF